MMDTDKPTVVINDLPKDHPLRNKALAGIRFRAKHWAGEDITVPVAERGSDWRYRKWSPWRTITDRWKLSTKCFNDLGPVWTAESEWSFPL